MWGSKPKRLSAGGDAAIEADAEEKNGKEKESVGYSVDSIRFCKTGREGEKREREGSLLGENPKLS